MRRLLAANLTRLRKTNLFWGTALLHIAFGLFRVYTICDDLKYGYEAALDDALFSYILIEGCIMAVFIAVFLGTEYSDGAVRNKIAAGHERGAIYLANLVTVTAACCLFIAVYLLTVLIVGLPLLGGPSLSAKTILLLLAGTLVTAASFCAVYTFLAMGFSSKSAACILCLLLYFGMMIGTTYAAAMLDAPSERMVIDLVDGETVSHMEPNPRYPSGSKRAVYQFVLDLLPTGQAVLYAILEADTLKLVLYSGAIVLLTTGGGTAYFRRKDIR